MTRTMTVSRGVGVVFSLVLSCVWGLADAQSSGAPSVNCHVTDGSFTACPSGASEWSDVTPIAFPASGSYLYVNQDSKHTNLYLMYDMPFRTIPLGVTDSVHINFDTVEQVAGVPKLILYDIYVYSNGQVQILQQGQPTPAGKIVAATAFGTSPNSSKPHVTTELQVPLVAGPPSTYSPDPLYWGASVPPSPPPDPCPTDPGKTYNRCVKAELNQAQLYAGNMAAIVGAAGALCSLLSAATCTPAEIAMIATAVVWQVAANKFGYMLNADPPGLNFTVPPDPNFTVVFQPPTYTFSVPTSQLTSAQEVAAFNAFSVAINQLTAYQEAAIVSSARAAGAQAANSPTFVTIQTQAAQRYAAQASTVMSRMPGIFSNIGAAFQAAGTHFTIAPSDVVTFQTAINPATPPAANSPTAEVATEFALELQAAVQAFNLSSAEQSLLLPAFLLLDPNAVSSLGIGAFPAALSDPTFAATLNLLATGLAAAPTPPQSLTQSFSETLPGDYVEGGVGLRGLTAGNITVAGIPAGATVEKAFLYWGMLDNGQDSSLAQLNLKGTPVVGSLIGSGPDTCWGRSNSYTFRADVTPQITGNGVYALTNVASGGSILAEGASLIVVYRLAGAPIKTVMIDDGNISIPNGASSGLAAFNFNAVAPVQATTTFNVGDGQEGEFGAPTPTSFTGDAGTLSFPGLFNSTDGQLWDTVSFNVSSVISAGPDTGTAAITVAGDCLLWSAQAFSVTSSAPTTPVLATAALVEANANGNTIAKQSALVPSAAPTVQDEVGFVVQFRTIANRSIVASTLTNQLVTGLVNDGVLTSAQASSVSASVLQNFVAPPIPAACDVNGDGQIDTRDLALITSTLNTSANFSADPRDANHDGVVNVLDARLCVTKCTHAGCAIQ